MLKIKKYYLDLNNIPIKIKIVHKLSSISNIKDNISKRSLKRYINNLLR